MENAFKEAYECDPGCICENIYIEYDQIVKYEVEISQEIIQLEKELKELYCQGKQWADECPEYNMDVDFSFECDDVEPKPAKPAEPEQPEPTEPEIIDGGGSSTTVVTEERTAIMV